MVLLIALVLSVILNNEMPAYSAGVVLSNTFPLMLPVFCDGAAMETNDKSSVKKQ